MPFDEQDSAGVTPFRNPMGKNGPTTLGRVLPDAKVVFTALGVTALLALAGFIVKTAQEQFLGLALTQWGASELSTTAARWLADSLLLVCQVGMQHPILAVLWCLLMFLPVILVYECSPESRLVRVARLFIIGGWVMTLLLTLIRVQLPVIPVENWLTAGLSDHFGGGSDLSANPCKKDDKAPSNKELKVASVCNAGTHLPQMEQSLHKRTLEYNREIFLSKAADIGRSRCNVGMLPLAVQAQNISSEQWPERAAAAERWLQHRYVLQIGVFAGSMLALLAFAGTFGSSRLDGLAELLLAVAGFALLPLCLLFVPYSYGKILNSTVLPSATLQFSADDHDIGWVLERTDSSTSLLTFTAKVPALSVYRNEKVQLMIVDGKEDVLRKWNASCWFDIPVQQ